jgi:hypothetical protein
MPGAGAFLAVSLVIVISRIISYYFARRGNKLIRAPILGSKWTIFARYQFFANAQPLVQEGYEKVKCSLLDLAKC